MATKSHIFVPSVEGSMGYPSDLLTTKEAGLEPVPKSPLNILSVLPMATLFAVVFSLATGAVNLLDPDKLSFQEYLTQVTVVWGAIAIGRGLASSSKTVSSNPTIAFLNALPWATVVAGIVGIVGYVDVLLVKDSSLDFQEYGLQMSILVGALGIGRGIGAFKKDAVNVMEPIDEHIDLINDEDGIEDSPVK